MQSYKQSLSAVKLLKPATLVSLMLVLAIVGGCGKRKPPLPPIEKVVQRAELSGIQRGDRVILSWTLPTRNAGAGDLNNINRADIYRLAEPAGKSGALSEEEFASRGTLISTVPVSAADFSRRTMNFVDRLDFAGQAARLRYGLRFVNESGQKAGFSNFVVIEPTAGVAERPTALAARASQDAVLLNWTAPTANIDRSTPANVIGFNVYRKESGGDSPRLLTKTPVSGGSYGDATFEFGKSYEYFVRTVSLGSSGQPIESAESDAVGISPKDDFPPAAPTALTIAAAPTVMSVFFASNLEKDLAGYRVYRSTDRALPRERWELLTAQPIQTNTFQDQTVTSGKTYYYYVVAVDKTGNTSEASEIVGDSVP